MGWSAAIARQQRVAVAQLAGQAFVRTARANGLSNSRILLRHAVPAALPSSISTIALLVPALFSGAVIVELLFSWPGVGSLLVQAINTRDYPLAAGATCLVGVATAFGVWLADALRWWSDPRSRVHAIHD